MQDWNSTANSLPQDDQDDNTNTAAPASNDSYASDDAPAEGTNLFIGNLSYNTTEEILRELLSQAGELKSVSVIKDRYTDRSRGFGFAEFTTVAAANKAIELFDGKEVDGRPIRVRVAKPRQERRPDNYRSQNGY